MMLQKLLLEQDQIIVLVCTTCGSSTQTETWRATSSSGLAVFFWGFLFPRIGFWFSRIDPSWFKCSCVLCSTWWWVRHGLGAGERSSRTKAPSSHPTLQCRGRESLHSPPIQNVSSCDEIVSSSPGCQITILSKRRCPMVVELRKRARGQACWLSLVCPRIQMQAHAIRMLVLLAQHTTHPLFLHAISSGVTGWHMPRKVS